MKSYSYLTWKKSVISFSYGLIIPIYYYYTDERKEIKLKTWILIAFILSTKPRSKNKKKIKIVKKNWKQVGMRIMIKKKTRRNCNEKKKIRLLWGS